MMGYRDPNDPDPAETAKDWDDYALEFGVAAYFEARYGFDIETLTEGENDETSH